MMINKDSESRIACTWFYSIAVTPSIDLCVICGSWLYDMGDGIHVPLNKQSLISSYYAAQVKFSIACVSFGSCCRVIEIGPLIWSVLLVGQKR